MLGGRFTTECLPDCPVPFVQCPASSAWSPGASATCSGRGACSTAVGSCNCFEGYAGESCEKCAYGWVVQGTRCVRQVGLAAGLLAAVLLLLGHSSFTHMSRMSSLPLTALAAVSKGAATMSWF